MILLLLGTLVPNGWELGCHEATSWGLDTTQRVLVYTLFNMYSTGHFPGSKKIWGCTTISAGNSLSNWFKLHHQIKKKTHTFSWYLTCKFPDRRWKNTTSCYQNAPTQIWMNFIICSSNSNLKEDNTAIYGAQIFPTMWFKQWPLYPLVVAHGYNLWKGHWYNHPKKVTIAELPGTFRLKNLDFLRFRPIQFSPKCGHKPLTWMSGPFWGSDSLTFRIFTTFWGFSHSAGWLVAYKLPS